jgi:hypothetical protein
MPAMIADVTAPARADATPTVVYTTLYDLVATVHDTTAPGEEVCVPSIVPHLWRAGHARFLRDVDVDTLWDDEAPACLTAEDLCVPA